jgi:hypothetical protein
MRLATLKAALLAAARHAADIQVSSGAWIPAQADSVCDKFSEMINQKLFSH